MNCRGTVVAIILTTVSLLITYRQPSLGQETSAEYEILKTRIISEYHGQYSCTQGITNVTIQFLRPEPSSDAVAIFKFEPSNSNQQAPRGAFLLRGTVDFNDGSFDLRPLSWLSQPPDYAMVGLSGTSSDEGKTLNGTILYPGCSWFSVTRIGARSAVAPDSDQKSISEWETELVNLLTANKKYPAGAISRGEQGTVVVSLTIDRNGQLIASQIKRHSGSSSLDSEVVDLLRRSQPFPPLPTNYTKDQIDLTLPIKFSLPIVPAVSNSPQTPKIPIGPEAARSLSSGAATSKENEKEVASKKDIWGFYPGMDNEQFGAKGIENKLYCKFWKFKDNLKFSYPFNDAEGNYCYVGHAGKIGRDLPDFAFYNTQYLSPNVIWKIQYHFASGKSRSDMISAISTAYNVQPISESLDSPKPSGNYLADVLREYQGPMIKLCLVGVGTEDPIVPSQLIAVWKLGQSEPLVLTSGQSTTQNGIEIPRWNLMLCDEKILADEKEAYQQKQRDLGPPTRF
jgi:TonB family protein